MERLIKYFTNAFHLEASQKEKSYLKGFWLSKSLILIYFFCESLLAMEARPSIEACLFQLKYGTDENILSIRFVEDYAYVVREPIKIPGVQKKMQLEWPFHLSRKNGAQSAVRETILARISYDQRSLVLLDSQNRLWVWRLPDLDPDQARSATDEYGKIMAFYDVPAKFKIEKIEFTESSAGYDIEARIQFRDSMNDRIVNARLALTQDHTFVFPD